MWMNKSRNTNFTLLVDNFGIKFDSPLNLKHSIDALKQKCTISFDMKGSLLVGVTLKWNYQSRAYHFSIPDYIAKLLQSLNHPSPVFHRIVPIQLHT